MQSVSAGTGKSAPAGPEEAQSLAVGCFAAICRDRLADALLRFSRDHPLADIGMHEMARGALLPALHQGTLSLAVMPGSDEPGTRSAELWQDRVMVAMPPGHRLAARETVTPAELLSENLLVSRQQPGADMHRFLARRILPLGPAPSATIVDLALSRVLARVAAGDGITLTCESHAEHAEAAITVRPVAAAGAAFPVRGYWREGPMDAALTMLITRLRTG